MSELKGCSSWRIASIEIGTSQSRLVDDKMSVYQGALDVIRSRLLDHKQLEAEFRHVAERDDSIDFTHGESELQMNRPLNRYNNVLP